MKPLIFYFTLLPIFIFAQAGNSYAINGVFNVYTNNYFDPSYTNLIANENAAAYFSEAASAQIVMPTRANGGVVYFNSQNLPYNQDMVFYSKNMMDLSTSKHWQVSGNGSIPAMNFYYEGAKPNFQINRYLISDTLKLSDTLRINFDGLANADSILVEFFDEANGAIQHSATFMAPNYTNSYYVVPSVYSTFSPGLRAVINIQAVNYSYQTISGKLFLFRNLYGFTKYKIPIVE